jgi:hypothetical protein
MLVLARVGDSYPDDRDPGVRYRAPAGLRPLPDTDGTPQAVLSRSADGGLLHLRLGAVWPELATGERPVPFDSARFRLLLQTPTARETGEWRPTTIAGDVLVERSVSLSAAEAAIARHLGGRTGDLVDVEVEGTLRGLAPAFPWLVSAPAETVRARIAALLGTAPATWEAVEAAFLGLSEDTFVWYPLEPGALRPPRDEALRAIARHAAPLLLTSSESLWTVAPTATDRLDLSLRVARVQTQVVGMRWSFSEFLAAQPDPGRHLIDISVPAPFAAADLSVANDLPLSPSGIRSIAFEARTGGPTGIVRHEFLPGQPGAARLRFVRETFEDLQIEWRARLTAVTAAGPHVEQTEYRRSGQLIDLNASTLRMTALRFFAEPDVFSHAQSIEVVIGTRTLTLTAAAPEGWAVGRQAPPAVAVTAVAASGERHSLGSMTVGPTGLTITSAALGVGETADVVIRPPDDVAAKVAYLAVQIEGHPWRTLDPGSELRLPVRRENRLQAPRVRYRTRQVTRGPDNTTAVMADSPWQDATGNAVALRV